MLQVPHPFFDRVVYTLQVQQTELEPLTKLFGDREQAIRNGMSIQGKRYEVNLRMQPLNDSLHAVLHSNAHVGACVRSHSNPEVLLEVMFHSDATFEYSLWRCRIY